MQPALNKEAIDCSKQHDAVYGNSRDILRHFATEKDKKRHAKTPLHNQNNKQNPKHKQTRKIEGVDNFSRVSTDK
jgi:hypothetical protein